jgi:hypothetical protein
MPATRPGWCSSSSTFRISTATISAHGPLIERKTRLAALLSNAVPPLHYSDYHRGQGPAFHEQACKLELEGIVSKRADAAYAPGNRGLWLKVKCLHREEFVGSAGPIPKERGPFLGLCCSPIMIPMGGSFTPAAPPPVSATRSSNGCGAVSNRWRRPRCRSTCRRRATAASDRR